MSTNSTLAAFFHKYPLLAFSRGEVVCSPGKCPSVYYLKTGLVRQSDKMLISFHRPGSFFPLINVAHSVVNPYSYSAYRTVKVYQAPQKEFLHYIQAHPELLLAINSKLIEIIHSLNARMQLLTLGNSSDRLVMFLNYLAHNFGETKGRQVIVNLPLSHQEIAHWIGTTRETVSWQMLDLRQKGLIAYSRRQIVIYDLPSLQPLVNFA